MNISTESTTLIEIKNAYKTYGSKTILKAYSKTFHSGSLTILKGKNGSGKTTLLKICMNKVMLDQGEIKLKAGLKIRYMPDFVELPYQDLPLNFIKWMLSIMKVRLDLAFLTQLELDLMHEVEKLSKGNKQKLLLYLALVGNPDIIYLDEPFTALDKKSMNVVEKRIHSLVETGTCVIISTHEHKYFKHIDHEVIDFDKIDFLCTHN